MQELFFELLRVAVGQMDCLSRGPSAQEWHEIYEMARHHGLIGVCYKGVERLFEFGLRVPQDLSIDWMADAEMIREEEEVYEQRCTKLVAKLSERKIRATILNGLGMRRLENAELQHLLRATAIDVFVDCSIERAVKFARQTGQEDIRCGYTSFALNAWSDTPVNLYYRVLSARNPMRNKVLQKWFVQNKEQLFHLSNDDIYVPTLTMNAVCMLQTFQQRLLKGKATMDYLVDYYYVLSKLKGDFQTFKDNGNMAQTLEILEMSRFAAGVMWVLQHTLGLERSYMLCETSEQEGQFILKCLMTKKHSFRHLLFHYPKEMIWPSR